MFKYCHTLLFVLALCLAVPVKAQVVLFESESVHYQAPKVPDSIVFAG